MTPWILLLLVPIITESFKNKNIYFCGKYHNLSFIITFVILFIFRGFRSDTVGGDLVTYKEAYGYLTSFSLSEFKLIGTSGYEFGFIIYNTILNKISNNFQTELIVTGLITTFCLLKCIFNNSRNPGFSLFIYITMYLYGSSFNNERQAIAIVILMLSIEYIKKRDAKRFVLFVFLATLFHTTSLVFLILYIVYTIKLSRRYWLLVIFSGACVLILSNTILSFIIRSFYSAKYDGVDLMIGGGYAYFALLVILIWLSFVFMTPKQKEDPNKRLWIHMLVIGAIMQILSFNMGYFYRAVILFSMSMIFYIPEVLSSIKYRSISQLCKVIVIILLVVYYYYTINNDTLELVPYSNILFR